MNHTLLIVLLLAPLAALQAAEIIVRDAASLRAALRDLKPGTTLKISPGEYPGGHSISGIERLTIEALDPQQPPVFKGGKTGFQFSRCAGLTLRHLRISGQSENGLNRDDGGDLAHPVTGITLEHLEVSDIGPNHNRITFRRSQVQTDINIGGGTAPETFRFVNNHWLAEDNPAASKPKLPVAGTGGVYGRVSGSEK